MLTFAPNHSLRRCLVLLTLTTACASNDSRYDASSMDEFEPAGSIPSFIRTSDPGSRLDVDTFSAMTLEDAQDRLAQALPLVEVLEPNRNALTGPVGGSNCPPPGNHLELPVVTHFSRAQGRMVPGATDTPELNCLLFNPLVFPVLEFFNMAYLGPWLCDEWPDVPRTGLQPSHENYWGEDFTLFSVSDDKVEAMFDNTCETTGVNVDFLRYDAVERGVLASNSGRVQIIHAIQIYSPETPKEYQGGALASIFLPPSWSADAPAGTYPIAFPGSLYDLNENLRATGGWAAQGAASSGAIMVLWNMGATANSASGDRRMRQQFQDLIDYVSDGFGGDRYRIIYEGGSRNGATVLSLAGNPDPHDYHIAYAHAAVPGIPKVFSNEDSWAYGAFGPVFGGTSPIIGQKFAWAYDLDSWSYPHGNGNGLGGLNKYEAWLKVLYGESDPDIVNESANIYSDRFVSALAASGTPLALSISSHDFFQENTSQIEYAQRLLELGVPVEIQYTVMGGHKDFQPWRRDLHAYEVLTGQPVSVIPGWSTHVSHLDSPWVSEPLSTANGALPLTVEHPRYTFFNWGTPFFVAGQEGTQWQIGLRKGGDWKHAWSGTLGASNTDIVRFDPPSTLETLGCYEVYVFVRYPGESDYSLIYGTPIDELALSDMCVLGDVPTFLPSSLASGLYALGLPNIFPEFKTTSWGVADQRQF